MNLNAIRLEGQLQPDYFFDFADEVGILDHGRLVLLLALGTLDSIEAIIKKGPVWEKEDYDIASKSQADQIKRLRSHPSLLVWLNGSDNPPPADVEQMYVDDLEAVSWPNPYLSSATAKSTTSLAHRASRWKDHTIGCRQLTGCWIKTRRGSWFRYGDQSWTRSSSSREFASYVTERSPVADR